LLICDDFLLHAITPSFSSLRSLLVSIRHYFVFADCHYLRRDVSYFLSCAFAIADAIILMLLIFADFSPLLFDDAAFAF